MLAESVSVSGQGSVVCMLSMHFRTVPQWHLFISMAQERLNDAVNGAWLSQCHMVLNLLFQGLHEGRLHMSEALGRLSSRSCLPDSNHLQQTATEWYT